MLTLPVFYTFSGSTALPLCSLKSVHVPSLITRLLAADYLGCLSSTPLLAFPLPGGLGHHLKSGQPYTARVSIHVSRMASLTIRLSSSFVALYPCHHSCRGKCSPVGLLRLWSQCSVERIPLRLQLLSCPWSLPPSIC